jgi:hypothetical protein
MEIKYAVPGIHGSKIGFKEAAAQEQVREVGGRWDRQQQVWIVPYGCIAGTKLEKFIVLETWKKDERGIRCQVSTCDKVIGGDLTLIGLLIGFPLSLVCRKMFDKSYSLE